jgi:hypothetical protein
MLLARFHNPIPSNCLVEMDASRSSSIGARRSWPAMAGPFRSRARSEEYSSGVDERARDADSLLLDSWRRIEIEAMIVL